jgi:hypothetical protein
MTCVCAVGENHSPGILDGQGCRAFPDGLGWLDGSFERSLGRCALFALGNWSNFSMQQFPMLSVPDEIGTTPPFVNNLRRGNYWAAYTGFLLRCSPTPNLLSDRAPPELHEPDNFGTFVSSPQQCSKTRSYSSD